MPVKLTPCPFCGSKDIGVNPLLPPFRAYCKDCGAEGPYSTVSPEMAKLYWNTAGCPGQLTWTKARPTKPGFYFYKARNIQVVKIDFQGPEDEPTLWCVSIGQPVSALKGKWAGPIPEPEEMEDDDRA